jgi:hypothetical protein
VLVEVRLDHRRYYEGEANRLMSPGTLVFLLLVSRIGVPLEIIEGSP